MEPPPRQRWAGFPWGSPAGYSPVLVRSASTSRRSASSSRAGQGPFLVLAVGPRLDLGQVLARLGRVAERGVAEGEEQPVGGDRLALVFADAFFEAGDRFLVPAGA